MVSIFNPVVHWWNCRISFAGLFHHNFCICYCYKYWFECLDLSQNRRKIFVQVKMNRGLTVLYKVVSQGIWLYTPHIKASTSLFREAEAFLLI